MLDLVSLKVGLGIGLLVCLLVPLALLLFGIIGDEQAAALVLFLGGLWTAIFGVAFAGKRDRLYNVGFGIIIMVLSTFIYLPLQYTAGLVVVTIIAVVLASIMSGPKRAPQQAVSAPGGASGPR